MAEVEPVADWMEPAAAAGARVRAERKRRGWTQRQLGEALEPFLGKAWPAQVVSYAESGGRQMVVTEMFALALALQVPPADLFRPPLGVRAWKMPTGAEVACPAPSMADAVAGLREAHAMLREAIAPATVMSQRMGLMVAGLEAALSAVAAEHDGEEGDGWWR